MKRITVTIDKNNKIVVIPIDNGFFIIHKKRWSKWFAVWLCENHLKIVLSQHCYQLPYENSGWKQQTWNPGEFNLSKTVANFKSEIVERISKEQFLKDAVKREINNYEIKNPS